MKARLPMARVFVGENFFATVQSPQMQRRRWRLSTVAILPELVLVVAGGLHVDDYLARRKALLDGGLQFVADGVGLVEVHILEEDEVEVDEAPAAGAPRAQLVEGDDGGMGVEDAPMISSSSGGRATSVSS
jgi:hypothetical protein